MNYKVPKALLLALPLIIASFFGYVALNKLSSGKQKIGFDNFALGNATSTSFGFDDGVQIHCQDLSDFHLCEEGYRKSNLEDVILWIGNSQLHAINQMQPDDEPATAILHRHLRNFGYYLLALSEPNANLQEHYLLFEYLLDRLPVKYVVLPVVFDDMRESGIRPKLEAAFLDSALSEKLTGTKTGRDLLANFCERDSAGNDMAAIKDTLQESTEKLLNKKLAAHSLVWEKRPELRGEIFLSLYKLRNLVFGITPSTVRKVLPGRYSKNIDALKDILDIARDRNIGVLVYIAPLRNDVSIPYDANQYIKFKQTIQTLSALTGARFVNLENLVPGRLWGTKDSTSIGGSMEYDFMHFKGEGHRILGERLFEELSTMLHKNNAP